MEYLWKKYEDKINSNNEIIQSLRKEKKKLYWKGFLDFFSESEKDFFEVRYNLDKEVSNLELENYLLGKRPYQEWASELSDSEVVLKYLFVSKFVENLKAKESKQLNKNINEYISRQNALDDEISRRTFVGWESVQLNNPPREGAVNFVKATNHNYYGPFARLKNSA